MFLDSKKSYYAIIPADVRYDKKIVTSAKLLYGEITALCNEKGYCWATNDYFSNLYSVSKKTISRWIKCLCEAGYVSAEFIFDDKNKKVKIRCLKMREIVYPPDKNVHTPPDKNVHTPPDKNVHTPRTKMSIPPGQKCPG